MGNDVCCKFASIMTLFIFSLFLVISLANSISVSNRKNIKSHNKLSNFTHNTSNHYMKKSTYNSKNFCANEKMRSLVNKLKIKGILKSFEVEKVFCSIDRKQFCPNNFNYNDESFYIENGATISAPRLHIRALEVFYDKYKELKGKKGLKVLDIGSGSGFLTLAFSLLFRDSQIIGIEHIKELVEKSKKTIEHLYPQIFLGNNFKIIEKDGRNGFIEESPYDFIHVGASFTEIPYYLLHHLNNNGRMFVPLRLSENDLKYNFIAIIDKDEKGKITIRKDLNEPYVLMQDKQTQIFKGQNNALFGEPFQKI